MRPNVRFAAHGFSSATRDAVAAVGVALVVAACGAAATASPPPASLSNAATVSTPSASAVAAVGTPAASPSDSPGQSPADSPADTSAAPSSAAADPCALITVAEANAVAGVTTLPPEPAGIPPTRCVWATPTSGAVGQVEIDVGDGAKKTYDIDRTILKHTFSAISGLADEAYAEDSTVFFRSGDTWVAIHVVRLDDSKVWMPKLVDLARTVATRL